MASSSVKETDTGWNELKKSLRKMGKEEVVVGIPGEIDFNTPTTAALGAVHEFGSLDGRIPERSFLRSTFDTNEAKYTRMLEKSIKKAIKSKKPDPGALFRLGETARGDVINRIRSKEIPQDLAPSTEARKGADSTALVDTGNLVGSITSVVRARKGK